MRLPTLTEIAKSEATFMRYSNRKLFYSITVDDLLFVFPIDVDDAGEGEFTPRMKGINVLRWARKFFEALKIDAARMP